MSYCIGRPKITELNGLHIWKEIMRYQPKPLDVTHVQLGPELSELLEKLARNTHDLWGQLRIKQGWTYGPARDDAKKQHPCLVPYEDLPESEKAYDRETSEGILKAILSLGCTIQVPQGTRDG
jgi:hypothetical protein